MPKALKHSSKSDKRFSLDDTPITSPWRSYNSFNKYDESFPISAFELFSSGKTIAQVARALKCSIPTIRRWMTEIEEFGEACSLGITNQQAHLEDQLQEIMIAEDEDTPLREVNTKLLEMYTKSQFKETYDPKYVDPNTSKSKENDGASALLDLLNKTDKLSINASTNALPDGTPAQTISIEKNAQPLPSKETSS